MITVEVAISFTMFLMFFLLMLQFINFVILQERIQGAICESAKELSVLSYLNTTSLEAGENSLQVYSKVGDVTSSYGDHYQDRAAIMLLKNQEWMSEDMQTVVRQYLYRGNSLQYLETMGLVNGLDGLDFSGSVYDPENGEIKIQVTYEVEMLKLPFLENGHFKKKVTLCASTGLWED